MDDPPFSSDSASYFVSKTKRGKQHLLQIMLVEQPHIMSFDKVQDRQVLQNFIAQISVILSFYFPSLLLKKPNHKETIVYGSS